MNVIETIKKRKSCRTFNRVALKPADKKTPKISLLKTVKDLEMKLLISESLKIKMLTSK